MGMVGYWARRMGRKAPVWLLESEWWGCEMVAGRAHLLSGRKRRGRGWIPVDQTYRESPFS